MENTGHFPLFFRVMCVFDLILPPSPKEYSLVFWSMFLNHQVAFPTSFSYLAECSLHIVKKTPPFLAFRK